MGNKKKKDKNRLDGLKTKGISIAGFMKRYLGVLDETLLQSKLTHETLAQFFPYLERTSFDFILDNPSTVHNGDVVLVEDTCGNYIPYVVVGLLEKLECQGLNYIIDQNDWGDGTKEDWNYGVDGDNSQSYNLEDMSIDALEKLMVIYKLSNQEKNFLSVVSELEKRFSTLDLTSSVQIENSDLKSLTTYELEKLMYFYKAKKDQENYYKVRDELVSRKDSMRASRLSKRKALEKSARRKNTTDYY